MRAICKHREPRSLTTHRLTDHADYDNYRDKDTLRGALVSEQRGLCCYCMKRIQTDANKMKIEHWHCQERYCDEQIVYRNLLGACLGGEGQPPHKQHCDTRKGNRDLLWNPAEPAHAIESTVQYGSNGTIWSSNKTFDNQLNQVLNLNLDRLQEHRRMVTDAIGKWWRTERKRCRGPVPREQIERKRNKFAVAYGELDPYSQVAVWWLSRKLEQAS